MQREAQHTGCPSQFDQSIHFLSELVFRLSIPTTPIPTLSYMSHKLTERRSKDMHTSSFYGNCFTYGFGYRSKPGRQGSTVLSFVVLSLVQFPLHSVIDDRQIFPTEATQRSKTFTSPSAIRKRKGKGKGRSTGTPKLVDSIRLYPFVCRY